MKNYAKFFPVAPEFDNYLADAVSHADLDTAPRLNLFLATVAHESNYLTDLVEVLSTYTATRLAEVWPKRFEGTKGGPNLKAITIAHNGYAIAEAAYGGRYGNGPEGSGDGWKYRGRGAGHLTFHDNYKLVSRNLGLGDLLVKNPDLVATPQYALITFADWWKTNKMNGVADDIGNGYLETGYDPWIIARKKVQGGTEGLDSVKKIYKKFSV